MMILFLIISLGIFAAVTYFYTWNLALCAAFAFICIVECKNVWLIIRTAPRDLTAGWRFLGGGIALRRIMWGKKTVPILFQERVEKHPDKVMFITADRPWTFQEVEDHTNKIANYFASTGLKAHDEVSLVMENRPEVVFIWLALSKIGVATAIINYNLRQSALAHCISAVNTKAVIFSPKMSECVLEIADTLRKTLNPKFYSYGHSNNMESLSAIDIIQMLARSSLETPSYRGNLDDKLIYIFTSGTTGMPKAAVIKHLRFLVCAVLINFMLPIRKNDIMYYYLPLYHMAGGLLGTSQSVIFGVTGFVATKFSASNFWTDCTKYNCTVTQYIGEICRYLYAQPPKDIDRKHSIRIMYGNGLRPQLWADFQSRFGVPHLRELYGSTEGNANMVNINNKVGSVGFVPTICRLRVFRFLANLIYDINIIKVDAETGIPIRDKNGLCIRVKPNEPGEIVATIGNRPQSRFDGYSDPTATNKKIYTNVFRKNDKCFASGDILIYDDDGYLFFKDRTGDTFRWKGENVSTAEVEGVISKHAEMNDCVVYGVEIPGLEGKAGMAALHDPEHKIALDDLLKKMRVELPVYAIPIFVRLCEFIEATGTFKLPKVKLTKEGYDLGLLEDPVYFLDPVTKLYVRLDHEMYKKIVSKQIRL